MLTLRIDPRWEADNVNQAEQRSKARMRQMLVATQSFVLPQAVLREICWFQSRTVVLATNNPNNCTHKYLQLSYTGLKLIHNSAGVDSVSWQNLSPEQR